MPSSDSPGEGGNPLVSVLTPVYNGEPYLAECIESVLAQTYGNWVYTIVDNCSTDRTAEIAADYAARSERIRVVRNEKHVRVIANHNMAISRIHPGSAYCKFVYADDWIFPECIEKMVTLAEKYPRVGIVAAYGLRGIDVTWDGLPYATTVIDGRRACRDRLLGGPYLFGTMTSVLFRSEVFTAKDPFFNEANLHGDKEACFEALQRWDLGFVHQVLSFTRTENDTLTSYSRRMNTYLPSYLHDLLKFGPAVLSPEELKEKVDARIAQYYKFLADQFFERRDKEFWGFHRSRLSELGYPLSRTRLAGAIVLRAVDSLLNPKRAVEGLVRRIGERRGRGRS